MASAAIRTYTNSRLTPPFGSYSDLNVTLVASKTYPKGCRLKETATPGVYDIAATTDPWIGINAYACVTDASSNITLTATSGQTGGDEWGSTLKYTQMMYRGAFFLSDLPGFDANAVTGAPAGFRFLEGSVAQGSGIVYLP